MADTASYPNARPRLNQPLDLADKLVQLQRRTAGPPRRRDQSTTSGAGATVLPVTVASPQSQSQSQHPPTATQAAQPDHDQDHHPHSTHSHPTIPIIRQPLPPTSPSKQQSIARRSPNDFDEYASRPSQGRLFNPNTPSQSRSTPTQQQQQMLLHQHYHHTREQDAMSEASSSNGRRQPNHPHPPPRQLFDPRKDDPVRFNLLTRNALPGPSKPPVGPPSGGYLSGASATSQSDIQSMGSIYSLTSGTTSSSASGPYSPAHSRDLGGNRLWLEQMKRMYREITESEKAILSEGDVVGDDEVMDSRTMLPTAAQQQTREKESDEKWARLVAAHKRLVELDQNFLSFALRPQVPASLQTLPAKYNIPARMWNHGFQRLLMALRRASLTSLAALEQLDGFIIYSYGFYTSLLEEEHLAQFRVLWIEALGDLARYKMIVAAHLAETVQRPSANASFIAPMSTLTTPFTHPAVSAVSPEVSRIDDQDMSAPSIGLQAAAELELEDEKELWRRTAREWYAKGTMDTPGQGRLHHHLGLVAVDAEGEELRAIYHFAKSLVANHSCDIARESILPLFSVAKQAERYQPSATAPQIFVLLQGILFTRIQLDDFNSVLSRLIERITLYPTEVSEAEWTMMGSLNVAAMLEYGRPDGLLRKLCGFGGTTAASGRPGSARTAKKSDIGDKSAVDQMDLDKDSDMADIEADAQNLSGSMMALSTSAKAPEVPYTLELAFRLTFELLAYALQNPAVPSSSPFRPPSLNPYITTVLTFLGTMAKSEQALLAADRFIPWTRLAPFFSQTHRRTAGSSISRQADDGAGGRAQKWFGSSPLPEDWCLRGSEWVRKIYERGFWRAPTSTSPSSKPEPISSEMDVLLPYAAQQVDSGDGIVEDDDDGAPSTINSDWSYPRWKRLRWAAETLIRQVPGLEWSGEGRDKSVTINGLLKMKCQAWEVERAEEEEAERRRRDRVPSPRIDDDDEMVDADEDDDAEDDMDDSAEVRSLKARRRYLRSLQHPAQPPPPPRRPLLGKRPHSAHAKSARPLLQVVAGYTVVVLDTNILLSSLPLISDLIQSHRWTVIVPLTVITELDGISLNGPTSELGAAGSEALLYITNALQAHSMTLKVQTSRGNYLHSLSIRSELSTLGTGERNMDDLILRSALWQADHFLDRSNFLLGRPASVSDKTSKVVLLTFDRNLRLKARARKLDAADEKDMAAIFTARR